MIGKHNLDDGLVTWFGVTYACLCMTYLLLVHGNELLSFFLLYVSLC
ncbi:unnamed protein product [Brassica oleracea]